MQDYDVLGESGRDAASAADGTGQSVDRRARPLSVRALEGMHIASFAFGLWASPKGMALMALPWLAGLLLATLAVTRLRLALVWLLYGALAIGVLIVLPMNAAFYYPRIVDNPWAIVRLAWIMALTTATLALLWAGPTTRWLRAGGGKLSKLVI